MLLEEFSYWDIYIVIDPVPFNEADLIDNVNRLYPDKLSSGSAVLKLFML